MRYIGVLGPDDAWLRTAKEQLTRLSGVDVVGLSWMRLLEGDADSKSSRRLITAIVRVTAQDLPTLERIAARRSSPFSRIPPFAMLRLVPEEARLLLPLSRLGVSDAFFVAIDSPTEIARRVVDAARGSAAGSASFLARGEKSDRLGSKRSSSVLRYCLSHADVGLTVGDVARGLHVSRRTLNWWLQRESLPSAATLIMWARLAHATALLTAFEASVEEVALYLGFGSGASLRPAFWRHGGLRVREARALDTEPGLLDVLLSRWHAQRTRPGPAPAPLSRTA